MASILLRPSKLAKLTAWLAGVAALVLIFSAPGATAQEPEDSGEVVGPTFGPRNDIERTPINGQTRVIIALDAPFVPEGSLTREGESISSSAAVRTQRNTINSVKLETVEDLRRLPDVTIVGQLKNIPFIIADVDPTTIPAIQNLSNVRSVKEDTILFPEMAWSNTVINVSGPNEAWEYGLDGSDFAVVVLDTGVQSDHVFLNGKVISEACFTAIPFIGDVSNCRNDLLFDSGPGASSPWNKCLALPLIAGLQTARISECSHGVHVSGSAAGNFGTYSDNSIAEPNDTVTMGGVATGADIIGISIITMVEDQNYCSANNNPTPCTIGYESTLVSAMNYVYNNLASVNGGSFDIGAINYSFGGPPQPPGFCDDNFAASTAIINQLYAAGIAFVTSSGNTASINGIGYPGCIENVVAVGASDTNHIAGPQRDPGNPFISPVWPTASWNPDFSGTGVEQVSYFSSQTVEVDLLAPGVAIESAYLGFIEAQTSEFDVWNGTSMASPHAAGAFAIMKQQSPVATTQRILETLRDSGTPIVDSNYEGNVDFEGDRDFSRTGSGLTFPRIDVTAAVTFFGTDFGDAPTLWSTNTQDPARHLIVPEYYLGTGVSAEEDPLAEDVQDDGVVLASFITGHTTQLGVTASVAYAEGMPRDYLGRLNAWVDFNQDGDFEDVGEQIADGLVLTGPYPQMLQIEVPDDAVHGQTLARFRYSTQDQVNPTGLAYNGEVEDYMITITGSQSVAQAR